MTSPNARSSLHPPIELEDSIRRCCDRVGEVLGFAAPSGSGEIDNWAAASFAFDVASDSIVTFLDHGLIKLVRAAREWKVQVPYLELLVGSLHGRQFLPLIERWSSDCLFWAECGIEWSNSVRDVLLDELSRLRVEAILREAVAHEPDTTAASTPQPAAVDAAPLPHSEAFATPVPPPRKSMPRHHRVWNLIASASRAGEGIQGKDICGPARVGQSDLTTHIIPVLKNDYGVSAVRGVGYMIAAFLPPNSGIVPRGKV